MCYYNVTCVALFIRWYSLMVFLSEELIWKTPKIFLGPLRLVFFSPHVFVSLVFLFLFVSSSLFPSFSSFRLCFLLFVRCFLKTQKQQKDFLVFSLFTFRKQQKYFPFFLLLYSCLQSSAHVHGGVCAILLFSYHPVVQATKQ